MKRDPFLAQVGAIHSQYRARTSRRPHAAIPSGVRDDWYNIVNNADTDSADIMLYGAIGGWFGVDADEFVTELRSISARNINLHINSPGGSIFDGAAIYTSLKRHSATITAYIDGLAASAASFIAMAADKIVVSRAATMMIHDGLCLTYGNRDDHAVSVELLDKLSNTIADLYAHRAGGTPEEWRERMLRNSGDGTWYTAKEAIAAGLADELDDPDPEEEGDPEDAVTTAPLAERLLDRAQEILAPTVPGATPGPPGRQETQTLPEQSAPDQQGREMAFAMLAASLR